MGDARVWHDLGRVGDQRVRDREGGFEVRPPVAVFGCGALAFVVGLGFVVNSTWGRTGDLRQAAFGTAFLLGGVAFAWLGTHPWLTADAAGLRVGPVRRVPVPWNQIEALRIHDIVVRTWQRPPAIRMELRSGRTRVLRPVLSLRTYRQAAELRHIAKRIALAADQHGRGPIPWPEHLDFTDHDGEVSPVR